MWEYLGLDGEAKALESAVEAVYREGKYLTYDPRGNTSTTDFAKAVLGQIRKRNFQGVNSMGMTLEKKWLMLHWKER
jgi:hypothetical protein